MPPSQLRGRPTRTTYLYDDPEHPNRITASYVRSPWTDEDRALMLAYDMYKATLCSGCGHPKATAWHPDNDGFFEVTKATVCHACTAAEQYGLDTDHKPDPRPHLLVVDTRDYEARPLPPLSMYDD